MHSLPPRPSTTDFAISDHQDTMPRSSNYFRLEIRASILPALQAILTGFSTALAVLLVVLWRPKRTRFIPFYSDATHNDPERIILAVGENLACFFMPLVALIEYVQQARLALLYPRLSAPRLLLCFFPIHVLSTRAVVLANFVVTSATTLFFFVTANVPSRHPYTQPHQFAASALILVYALQATFKAVLAHTFLNYDPSTEVRTKADLLLHNTEGDLSEDDTSLVESQAPRKSMGQGTSDLAAWWDRQHMKLRLLLAASLWLSLLATWLCYMGRVVTRNWGLQYEPVRRQLSVAMAVIVHIATGSCVTLMCVMAVDLRNERISLVGRTA